MGNRKVIQVSSKYTTKEGEEKWRNANVGSAWIRDNGEISIQLDPGISIASIEGVRITIREPFDPQSQGAQRQQSKPQQRQGQRRPDQDPWNGAGHNGDDDIPFARVGDVG